jgi:hypothetical protein
MLPVERLRALEALPPLVARALEGLTPGDLRRRPRDGGFALVEHVWHLADMEVEAFAARLERLLSEDRPVLPDFDGDGAALDRRYLSCDASQALKAFEAARAGILVVLAALPERAWARAGTHEVLGPLTLGDLPEQMLRHDLSHAGELAGLLEEISSGHPAIEPLRELAAGGRPAGWRAA